MPFRRSAFALFGALLLLVFSLPVAAAPVLRDGVYLVQMSGSDLTVAATSSSKGARLVLWPHRPTATWRFTHLGKDIYKITTNATAMDLSGGERRNGVPVIIWPWHGGKNQQWKIIRKGRHYNIVNVATGLALDLPGNKRSASVKLQGYSRNSSDAQLFDITPAGSSKKMRKKLF